MFRAVSTRVAGLVILIAGLWGGLVPFVAPYFSSLLDRTPKPQPPEPRAWRKDEYPD